MFRHHPVENLNLNRRRDFSAGGKALNSYMLLTSVQVPGFILNLNMKKHHPPGPEFWQKKGVYEGAFLAIMTDLVGCGIKISDSFIQVLLKTMSVIVGTFRWHQQFFFLI